MTGGTLSGTLNGTNLNLSTGLDVNGNFTNNLNSNISALFRGFQIILAPNSDYQPTRIHFPNRPINFTFANYGSGIRHKWGESDARNSFLSLYTSNPFNLQIDAVSINSSGDVGIKDTTPSFTLDVNGTLGVTGATTLSAPLTVNSSAVFNEGSTDSDFRVESDGNANMVFVDASTDRVGIGTNAPTKTLDVNGEVRINTVTATPTSLLGKDGSNVVGNVRLTSPLSLAGDSLNLATVPISKGGTGATSASVARSTLDIGYTFFSTTTGGTIVFSSNRVYLVITGTGSTTTIDLTTATNGREYMIKNLSNATVISSASNVIPLAGGSPTTAILSAGNVTPQWVTLVADGTNWHVMQRN